MKAGWKRSVLGDVCEIVNGGTPKTGVTAYWGGEHAWITPAEMGKLDSPYVEATARTLTNGGLANSSARLLPSSSVVLSSRAPIGHLVINTVPMATNQGCKGLVPSKQVEPKFLYYYLSSIVPLLNELGTGATFKELSGNKLREVPIPVPPLPEQRRIVGVLDNVFEGIATAKVSTEKNLQNTREVFESELAAVFTRRDATYLPRRLDDVCREITVGHVGPMATKYRETGIPFLRSQNIRPFEVALDNVVYIDQAFHRTLKKSQLAPGDVAVVRTGYPGTAAVIPETLPLSNCADLVIVRPGPTADPHYLVLFFNSRLGKELVAGRLVGAAQKHYNIKAARQVSIPIPPLVEQRRVVTAMNEMGEQTERLEAIYQQKIEALDELKQSLLHRAFSGDL